MKIVKTLQLATILFLSLIPKFVSATKDKEKVSIPIVISIPNNEQTASSSMIHIQASLDVPQGSFLIESESNETKSIDEPVSIRTSSSRDGKVDVDIIIKTAGFSKEFLPQSNEIIARLSVGEINFITVDNISGVFQNQQDIKHNAVIFHNISVNVDDSNEHPTILDITNQSIIEIGEIQFNEVSSIEINKNKLEDILLYPNPVNGTLLNIASKSEFDGLTEIVIHNAIGNLVKKQNTNQNIGNTTIQVNVDELGSGVYFLTVSDASGKTVKKFTIAH